LRPPPRVRLFPYTTLFRSEGNLWLGTEQGLVQLQRRRIRAYTKRDGLADDHVWSVCEGNEGTIWAGTDRGLSRIQNGHVVPLGRSEEHTSELQSRVDLVCR